MAQPMITVSVTYIIKYFTLIQTRILVGILMTMIMIMTIITIQFNSLHAASTAKRPIMDTAQINK
jgi:hypothetical protein